MRYLIFFALIVVVAAKPMPGYLSGSDLGGHGFDYAPAYSEGHAAPLIQTAQVVHAAPIIHAPIVAKQQATSYSSFQRVIHPVAHHVVQAEPVVHAAPIVHAPVIQSEPLLSIQSHEPISFGHSLGHGFGHGSGHGSGYGSGHGSGHGW